MKNFLTKIKIAFKTLTQRLVITLELYSENGLANHSAAGAYGFLLSVAPMLLLIAFFILTAFKSVPEAVATLFSNIPFLNYIIDEQWLTGNFLAVTKLGISGIISVICILWAGRILALSMQRGLKIIFKGTKKRNFFKDTLITLALEIAVLIFVFMLIFGSQPALFFYRTFDFIPKLSNIFFPIFNIVSPIYPIFILWLISFFAYLFTPVNSPNKLAALQGALFCAISYGVTSLLLDVIINRANYNLLYGTLGNVIIMLVNVYFFFIFFFAGAQFAFVVDTFDILLFTKLRQSRIKATEYSLKKNLFSRFDFINRLFLNPEGKLKKYMQTFKPGEKIFSQGDSGNDIYYLLDGEVEVILYSTNDGNNTGKTLSVYKPGIFFGEMGYLLSEKRSATTIAKTSVCAIVLPPSIFEKILMYDTNLDRALIENITRRLKNTNDKLSGGVKS